MALKKHADTQKDRCNAHVIHLDRVNQARRKAPSERDAGRLAQTFKALADQTRVKMLIALSGGEMCVCDMAAYLGITDSAVSHHLRRLKDLFLVKSRREGQMLYYSLDDDHVAQILDMGLAHVRE